MFTLNSINIWRILWLYLEYRLEVSVVEKKLMERLKSDNGNLSIWWMFNRGSSRFLRGVLRSMWDNCVWYGGYWIVIFHGRRVQWRGLGPSSCWSSSTIWISSVGSGGVGTSCSVSDRMALWLTVHTGPVIQYTIQMTQAKPTATQ